MEMTCDWVGNQNFLRRRYTVYNGDDVASSGVQVVGWDPNEGTLTSWIFDSAGGFGRGFWSRNGDGWMIESHGTTGDGENMAATNIITVLSQEEFRWQSTDRNIEGYALANTDPIRLRRVKAKKKADQ